MRSTSAPRREIRAGALAVVAAALAPACGHARFASDVAFLKKHTDVVVLRSDDGRAQVAVCPKYQGRVMTSTADGDGGSSFGWINRAHIEAGQVTPHMNPYGGEDRFWLGPEGGQYALYFAKGDPFDLEHWQVPPPIDTEAYAVEAQASDRVSFKKRMRLVNYAGTAFDVEVKREVRLLESAEMWKRLGVDAIPEDARLVAFESDNRITNVGGEPWTKERGLPSIWILGMFTPSDESTIVIPIKTTGDGDIGPPVNDAYFGKVPSERLKVDDGVIFFRGDGRRRSKIGVSARRAKPVAGSYDGAGVLTLIQYTLPDGVTDYVNSMWQTQEAPFGGDAVNSYNDGPPAEDQKPLGPFYELESSSPAAALAPGDSIAHVHRTIHIQGPRETLDAVARGVLGVPLDRITSALPRL